MASSQEGSKATAAEATALRYEQQLRELNAQRDAAKQRDRRWHTLRLATFLVTLGCWLFGLYDDRLAVLRWVGGAGIVAFLVVITLHQRVRDQLELLRRQRQVTRRLLARLQRRWDRLPTWHPPEHWLEAHGVSADVADDLDLFGRGSLFQFVSLASTGPGLRTLAQWLGGPAMAEEANARADAVEVLAPHRPQREAFYVLAKQVADGTSEPDHFVRWAEGDRYLAGRRGLALWARLAPLALVVGLGVAALLQSLPVALGVVAVVIGANLLLTVIHLGPIHDIFSVALSGQGDLEGYVQLFKTARHLPGKQEDAPESLKWIRETLVGDGEGGALAALAGLRPAARMAMLRHSGLLFILYVLLQAVALWDVHVLRKLERWQGGHGKQVADWFVALGRLEAFMSLAAIRDEYPEWSRATWGDCQSDAGSMLTATDLGHPLLPDAARVCNDLTIGPPGTVLLVTGSNMSGKSTMLRSVGLNVMLAAAGGPVCAKTFQLPPLELSTSIRVRDSVREGVSFYMAELQRLRAVVQDARRLRDSRQRRVLYLLDEILQGTNNRERQIAVARVLGHLIDTGAIGAISTHDLDLAEDPLLRSVAQPVHFREIITQDEAGKDTMTFDYRMREGVTPTTNALRLLEIVGLGDEEPADTTATMGDTS